LRQRPQHQREISRATATAILTLLSAGAELRFACGFAAGAKFDGEFAARSQTYTGTATVRWAW